MPAPAFTASTHPRFDLVICDIDGCLAPESSHPMDLATLKTIADFCSRASSVRDVPRLTLCSGRPQPFAEAMSRIIGAADVPLICENGVWMYHPASNTYDMDPRISALDRAAVREASAWLDAEYGPHGVTQQPGKASSISLYHPDPEFLRSIRPRLEAEFARRDWPFRVSMTWFYINCDLKHVSKGTGLDRLFRTLNCSPERCAGIGDTLSDLAIAQRTAWFACPANAAPEIAAHAHYTSPLPEARGVADILNHIVCMLP